MTPRREAKTTIPEREAGIRLDYWLAKRFTYHTRRHWQELVRGGQVHVNGKPARVSKRLHPLDRIEYRLPDMPEPEVCSCFEKILENDQFIVVNKPGNLPCHPAGKFFQNTLWYQLKTQLKNFWIINRLDRETSGLVLIAKELDAARHLNKQFAQGKIKKFYEVLVEGSFPDYLTVKGYLETDFTSAIKKQKRVIDVPEKDGIPVLTHFRKIEEKKGLSFVQAIPKTGKFHQIRASLSSQGYPVVGDKIYGCVKEAYLRFITNSINGEDRVRLRLSRQALHAYKLQFLHPKTKDLLSIKASLPPDFHGILKANGFNLIRNV